MDTKATARDGAVNPSDKNRYGVFRLTESDRPALRAHLLALDKTDRYLRFGHAVSDHLITSVVNKLNFEDLLLGLFREGELLGLVMVMPEPEEAHASELAISIAQQARGNGWGEELVRDAMLRAYLQGTEHMVVHYLRENQPMAHICQHFPGEVTRFGHEATARLDIGQWVRNESLAMNLPPCELALAA